jgi:folate-binding protein YgfZ
MQALQNSGSYLGRIRVGGADAETFLQGQLTQDVRAAGSTPLPAGYCSPKGRLLALMSVTRDADGFVLELHRGVLAATLKRLRLFVLRSKVMLEEVPCASPIGEAEWRRNNILAGLPVIYPETSDHFVPQMVNLDQLGGVSFSKGCYTGQEIVARLHYLGNLKRRMFLLRGAGPAPAPGTQIQSGEDTQAVGEVVDAVQTTDGTAIAAVLQLGHAESAALRLNGPDGAPLGLPEVYRYGQDSREPLNQR